MSILTWKLPEKEIEERVFLASFKPYQTVTNDDGTITKVELMYVPNGSVTIRFRDYDADNKLIAVNYLEDPNFGYAQATDADDDRLALVYDKKPYIEFDRTPFIALSEQRKAAEEVDSKDLQTEEAEEVDEENESEDEDDESKEFVSRVLVNEENAINIITVNEDEEPEKEEDDADDFEEEVMEAAGQPDDEQEFDRCADEQLKVANKVQLGGNGKEELFEAPKKDRKEKKKDRKGKERREAEDRDDGPRLSRKELRQQEVEAEKEIDFSQFKGYFDQKLFNTLTEEE